MERLTTRDKNGVAVMRSDLPPGQGNNLVARLADYEDSGVAAEMVTAIGWIGRDVWVIGEDIDNGEAKVFEGQVTSAVFGRYTSRRPKRVEVEVRVGSDISHYDPENVFLTREDAEAALAQLKERETRREERICRNG